MEVKKSRFKKIRLVLSAALIALIFIIYKQSLSSVDVIRCQVDAEDTGFFKESVPLSYELRVNYIFNAKNESIANMTGYVIVNKHRYRILRTKFFMLNLTDNMDIYNIRYTREKIHFSDNVPNEIGNFLMSAQMSSTDNYIRIEKIKDNTFVIHGISQPVALCYSY
ncbi:FidL-like protein [Serratia fonticola]|uniref:FidL-like protein n=1 Tax=Serratia fonticola TaxID=47917 RepID=UPI00164504D0|nr:FidL-like protein [Serratia fonticola]MBC3217500.1 hypothetical protein [Serratia fonticola]